MFKVVMTALILAAGVKDKDVQKVYDKFLENNVERDLHTNIDELLKDLRKAIKEA